MRALEDEVSMLKKLRYKRFINYVGAGTLSSLRHFAPSSHLLWP